jgi:hypothetical protein
VQRDGSQDTPKNNKKNFFVSPKNILHTQVCHIFVQVDFYPPPHVMALLRRLREKRVPVWIPPRPSGAYMGKGYRGMRTGEHGGGPAFALALWPLWALSVFGWVQNERLNLLVCWASRGQHLHIKLKLASLLQTPPRRTNAYQHAQNQQGGRPPTPPRRLSSHEREMPNAALHTVLCISRNKFQILFDKRHPFFLYRNERQWLENESLMRIVLHQVDAEDLQTVGRDKEFEALPRAPNPFG